MEVQPNSKAQQKSEGARPAAFDPTLRVREELERRVNESRTDGDRIDVSDRALTIATGSADAASPDRAARVQVLRAQAQSGQLNSPERAEKSADRMLGA